MRHAPFVLIALLALEAACSRNGSGDAGLDAGTDLDTDSDADADSDVDSDADGDTDSNTGPIDAGSWEWQDNPTGDDCGPGCKQMTFSGSIREFEWDVWDRYIVYSGKSIGEGTLVKVTDIQTNRHMTIPDVHPDNPIVAQNNAAFIPVVYMHTMHYNYWQNTIDPYWEEIVRVDLDKKQQEVIWKRKPMSSIGAVMSYMDVYGSRVISKAGCGDPESFSLCVYEEPWPSEGEVLWPDTYGLANSIWGDILVFLDTRNPPEDITGYNFQTKEFFNIADENGGDEYQSLPRIQGNRVVYMDFRFGSGTPTGSWEHAAIFMKDLSTGDTVQITDGAAIASYPDIYGDIVVWTDYRNCSNPQDKNDIFALDVYGYNLKTKTEFRVTNAPDRLKANPRIWGDKVFLDMAKDGGGNAIYMFDLPAEAK
jgi:beta propeller repeat protein